MIEVKRIDNHGFKVSIRLNGRSTQYFTELEAIKLRDKLIAVLSPIPPTPNLLALLKRCKPWLELDLERRKFTDYDDSENKAYGDKAISELNALLSDIAKAEEAR